MQRTRTTRLSAAVLAAAALVVPLVLVPSACSTGGGGSGGGPVPGAFAPAGLDFSLDPAPLGPVDLEPRFGASVSFSLPTFCEPVPGLANGYVVGEKTGRIWLLTGAPSTPTQTMFLDLSAELAIQDNELGLFQIAFDPGFDGTDPDFQGEVYLSFTRLSPMRSVLSRFTVDASATAGQPFLDPASEEEILEIEQPFGNHNGGHIEFAPDGTLLMALGDGGAGGDPLDNGQDRTTLLGKILRLDVRGTPDMGLAYAIPPDNPFVGMSPTIALPEIWAYGLRNPWRFAVDPLDTVQTTLWVGDVGQNAFEEVGRVRAGENHGWRVREGRHPFTTSANTPTGDALVDPVWDYGHDLGLSVTGGRVYQGTAIPELTDHYIFGDFSSGRIWSLAPGAAEPSEIASLPALVSFHVDHDGELLLVAISGTVMRLVPAGAAPAPAPIPDTLSATGLFTDTETLAQTTGVHIYHVASRAWNDPVATLTTRHLAVPGEMTLPSADRYADAINVPEGTVVAKTFSNAEGRRLETRVMVRTRAGWRFYNYLWRDDQTDADRITAATTVTANDDQGNPGTHIVPSPTECITCHRPEVGTLLGLNLRQLTLPQRAAFAIDGRFAETINDPGLPLPLVDPGDTAQDVEERAHSFLAVNCSGCHRPDTGIGGFDLRSTTALSSANLIDVVASSGAAVGMPGADLVEPGASANSVLFLRASSTMPGVRMPPAPALPMGVTVAPEPHPFGLAALQAWIDGL